MPMRSPEGFQQDYDTRHLVYGDVLLARIEQKIRKVAPARMYQFLLEVDDCEFPSYAYEQEEPRKSELFGKAILHVSGLLEMLDWQVRVCTLNRRMFYAQEPSRLSDFHVIISVPETSAYR